MATDGTDQALLLEAFSFIDDTPEMEETILKIWDLLNVDHLVYYSSKMGASLVSRSLRSHDLPSLLDQALLANGICRY